MATTLSARPHAGVRIHTDDRWLRGQLGSPAHPRGLVLLAHEPGTNRRDWDLVATRLARRGFATLSIDLVTAADAMVHRRMGQSHFEITMLTARLLALVDWATARQHTARLPIGVLGAGSGAGAALTAAAIRPGQIAAVIACDGPLDLVAAALPAVAAPTLLVVPGCGEAAIAVNRDAMTRMPGDVVLDIVPGAEHVPDPRVGFGPVADLAVAWFDRYLVRPSSMGWAVA